MGPRLSRRQVLLGAAGTLGAAGAVGIGGALLERSETPAPPPQRVPRPVTADGRVRDAVAQTEWVSSAARGRSVRLVTVLPAGAKRSDLPVCDGLRGNAQWWSDPGTRRLLGAAWARGVPPFAVVALDCGDNYWHPVRPTDDPLRMLTDELPGWLRERGLGGAEGLPAEVAGVSMGGTGAMIYARARLRAGRPLRAMAALSPGLFTDWRIASRRPFAGEPDWIANDPLRFYPEIASIPAGVWCGDNDPFVNATRRYMDLARPEVASVTPGRHDGAYYATALPRVFDFLGDQLRGPNVPTLPDLRSPFPGVN